MSMYGDYIKERLDRDSVEMRQGFATYEFTPDGCYMVDVYVKPEFRQQGFGGKLAEMIQEIAITKGCKRLYTSVVPSTKGATESIAACLAYGFKLHSSRENFIVLSIEL